jgi:hypothetical protein
MHTRDWHDTMVVIFLRCSHRIREVTERRDLGDEEVTESRDLSELSVRPFPVHSSLSSALSPLSSLTEFPHWVELRLCMLE